jgi:hypothetical protein
MYVRKSSKKRKYLIVKLLGTSSNDWSLYVFRCRYNGCINRWDVLIRRSARRSMKLKFISIRCLSSDVISMQCTSFVLSVMAINTCYEQCFCLLVNEKTKGTTRVPRYYFEHLCAISSCLVARFSCNVLSNLLCK